MACLVEPLRMYRVPPNSSYRKERFLLATGVDPRRGTGTCQGCLQRRVENGNGGYRRPMAATVTEPIEDAPQSSARAAGLRYVSDREPGFARRRRRKGFQYIDAEGGSLSSEQVERIEALAIPPAWTDVWICPSPNGHLQATGRDARGRKQYRYHPRWREVRDETKYERLLAFAQALPRIRRRVERDIGRRALGRDGARHGRAPAGATNIRVGNDEYARDNKLVRPDDPAQPPRRGRRLADHASVPRQEREAARRRGDRPRVARVLSDARICPASTCSSTWTPRERRSTSTRPTSTTTSARPPASDFTAKDFRTWSGTVLAAWALEDLGEAGSQTRAKRQVVRAVESVAKELGNTPAVCRSCYVHPGVIEAHLEGTLGDGAWEEDGPCRADPARGGRARPAQGDRLVSCSDRIPQARSNRVERPDAWG